MRNKLLLLFSKARAGLLIGAIASAAVSLSASQASVLQLEFETAISQAYDYPTGSYVNVGLTGTVALTMDFGALSPTDYGTTTINSGGNGSAQFASPYTALVGPDPFGSGVASAYTYSFPSVSDYPTTFIEEVAAQGNAHSPSGQQVWNYHIELRVTNRSSPRSGLGIDDYAIDIASALDIIALWRDDPTLASFSETWEIYDSSTGSYLQGRSYSDYAPVLSSVLLDGQELDLSNLEVQPVPLPAALPLLGCGVGLLGFVAWRRRRRQLVVLAPLRTGPK